MAIDRIVRGLEDRTPVLVNVDRSQRMSFSHRTKPAVLAAALVLVAGCGGGDSGGDSEGQDGGNAAAAGCDAAPNYPSGPVELIVPWAAGGGTDSVARFVATQLAEKLDTQVNVVNRTGGGGVVGHSAIATGRPDGSTIGLATVEITMLHWQGLTDLTYEQLTPIAMVNSDPAGVTVAAEAPWDEVAPLIEAAEADPGSITASGTGRGGIWNLAMAGMLLEAGVDPQAVQWVPSEGAAPALQELVAGGIDVSTASLVENQTMISTDRVKAIGIMADERDPKFPDVPTLKEQGIDFTMAAWRGIAGPAGMPDDVVEELSCHLDEIVHGAEYEEFMSTTGFGIEWKDAEEFGEFMAEQDAQKGEIMEAAGLAG
jgi:tripartite-type tricarboxylate transporter receptor subunit TctC